MSKQEGQKTAREWGQIREVLFAVTFYWTVSISLVFINKWLFSADDSHISPAQVTIAQCLVASLCNYSALLLGKTTDEDKVSSKKKSLATVMVELLPAGMVFAGMLACSNYVLKYVDVPFYMVARSLTIAFNVLFDCVVNGKVASKLVLLSVCIITAGFLLGIEGEIVLSVRGVLFGLMSSGFVCLHNNLTSKSDHDKYTFSVVTNALASFILLPPAIMEGESVEWLLKPSLLGPVLVSCVCGFLIGLATVMQIRATSPVTHSVSATAKATAQAVLGYMSTGTVPTLFSAAGISLVLGGSLFYSYLRIQEKERPRVATPPELELGVPGK